MERFKTNGSILLIIYLIIGFFSGIFFYGQAKSNCIEQHGWFKGLVLGCDVIEGNFGPSRAPSHVTSQLKGLFWPYYFFLSSSEIDRSVINVNAEYPFGTPVEEQLAAVSKSVNMFDNVKIAVRCSVILKVNAEGVRRSDSDLYDKLTEGSDKLSDTAHSMMLMHFILTNNILESSLPIDISGLRSNVKSDVSKQIAFYETPFDDLIERIENGTVKPFNEEAQKIYRKDIEMCIDYSMSEYGLEPFEDILERFTTDAL